MKRSEELRSLANRLDARAASLFFPHQPEMAADMKAAADVVREKADEAEGRENAASAGNGKGPDHAIPATVAG